MDKRISGAEAIRLARAMALEGETPILVAAGFTHDGSRVWYFRYEVR